MPPSGWRDDLQAALPGTAMAGSVWLGNLNAAHPWRAVVGDIVLPDGRRAVLKYHTDIADLRREEEAARLLAEPGAPAAAPACLGADEVRRVIVFARLTGPDLHAVLDTLDAWTAWTAAAQLVADVHRWGSRCPAPPSQAPHPLPAYDKPEDALLAPFRRVRADTPAVAAAIRFARRSVAQPGPWLGFCHGDLQTRHFLVTPSGMRLVDWECSGPRHRLYDLACLLAKPVGHGRRLPERAMDAAVDAYADTMGEARASIWTALAPVLAYERLIGVAEDHELEPAKARADLEDLVRLAVCHGALAPLAGPAAALRAALSADDLPLYAGLQCATRPAAPDPRRH